MSDIPRIQVININYAGGGVMRVLRNLAWGYDKIGGHVEFVVDGTGRAYLDCHLPRIKLVEVPTGRTTEIVSNLLTSIRSFCPDIVLSAGYRDDSINLTARKATGTGTKHVIQVCTNNTALLKAQCVMPWKAWNHIRRTRRTCREADSLIAISGGVADDIAAIAGLPRSSIYTPKSPLVTEDLLGEHTMVPAHPWFDDEIPLITSAGRLRKIKDFPTLLAAFARASSSRPLRLIVLGGGREKPGLMRLARKLGVDETVYFADEVLNPADYIAHSRLFVHSSRVEGLANVIVEALACGTPVVSTDCRSGPNEILQNGRYGRLVPVGDAEAMAAAILESLDQPVDRDWLHEAVAGYRIENSVQEYLRIFRLLLGA